MSNNAGKSNFFALCIPPLAFSIFAFISFSCSLSFAQDPNALNVQMLHIAIRADVNQVHFENIWVFKRQSTAQGPTWNTSIALPEGAIPLAIDEPNQTEFLPASKTIRKEMAADSLIDSVGFTFAFPNRNGACQSSITPSYRTDSILVSVSGKATKFTSNLLKYDDYRTARSRFTGVYTAANLPAGTKVEMNLSSLPRPDGPVAEYISTAGLALTIGIALIIILCKRRRMKHSSRTTK